MKPLVRTIPSHSYEPTSDKNIFRFVDRKGDWTHYWIKSQKLFVPAVNHIIRAGYPKGERFYQYLLHSTPEEAERKLHTAGEEGARTHDAIRDLIKGERVTLDTTYFNELTERFEPLNASEWQNLETFSNWCKKYQPQVIVHEMSVWSPQYLFAGTIDFLGTIMVPEGDKTFPQQCWNKRILILIDWKTSSGIWDEYELQIAAYRKAALEYLKYRLPLAQFDSMWTGIVRLGTNHKSGFEMKVWNGEESENNFDLFLSAYSIYRRKFGDVFEEDIQEIPAEFLISVPKFRKERKKTPIKGHSPKRKHMV